MRMTVKRFEFCQAIFKMEQLQFSCVNYLTESTIIHLLYLLCQDYIAFGLVWLTCTLCSIDLPS